MTDEIITVLEDCYYVAWGSDEYPNTWPTGGWGLHRNEKFPTYSDAFDYAVRQAKLFKDRGSMHPYKFRIIHRKEYVVWQGMEDELL